MTLVVKGGKRRCRGGGPGERLLALGEGFVEAPGWLRGWGAASSISLSRPLVAVRQIFHPGRGTFDAVSRLD
jgi:hypothetical protein